MSKTLEIYTYTPDGNEQIVYRRADGQSLQFKTIADVVAYCLHRIEELERKLTEEQ